MQPVRSGGLGIAAGALRRVPNGDVVPSQPTDGTDRLPPVGLPPCWLRHAGPVCPCVPTGAALSRRRLAGVDRAAVFCSWRDYRGAQCNVCSLIRTVHTGGGEGLVAGPERIAVVRQNGRRAWSESAIVRPSWLCIDRARRRLQEAGRKNSPPNHRGLPLPARRQRRGGAAWGDEGGSMESSRGYPAGMDPRASSWPRVVQHALPFRLPAASNSRHLRADAGVVELLRVTTGLPPYSFPAVVGKFPGGANSAGGSYGIFTGAG